MDKIYDVTKKRACVYQKVRREICLSTMDKLIKELKKVFPDQTQFSVHHFNPPQYSFTGFGVSVQTEEKPDGFTEVENWL